MGSIFHIIKEERQRLNQAKRAYQAAIRKEEQGAPQVKRVGLKDYLYLARRQGQKVRFRYIGHVDEPKAQNVLESVKRRREYQELLKGINNDLKEVQKALRGQKV